MAGQSNILTQWFSSGKMFSASEYLRESLLWWTESGSHK